MKAVSEILSLWGPAIPTLPLCFVLRYYLMPTLRERMDCLQLILVMDGAQIRRDYNGFLVRGNTD